MAGLLTQHALRALNVPVSSADTKAERASVARPIGNWCALVDWLSEALFVMEWRLVCRFKGCDCS